MLIVDQGRRVTHLAAVDDQDVVQKEDKFFLCAVGFVACMGVPIHGKLAEELVVLTVELLPALAPFFRVFDCVVEFEIGLRQTGCKCFAGSTGF